MLRLLRALTPVQRNAVIASYLAWTLDAFDFFILVFVLKDVAKEFATSVATVSWAFTLTLAARPVGALLFGSAADRYGRRAALMVNILLFSSFEVLSGLAPNLSTFLIARLAFGVAMGGVWGIAAALAMETIPAQARGVVSGILQAGYPTGYLLVAMTYSAVYSLIGWRYMFMAAALPALLLVVYIWRKVEESPAFPARAARQAGPPFWRLLIELWAHRARFCYVVLLMTAFNFLSHGTQDLYPTFLQLQLRYSQHAVGAIAIFYNVGAVLGGLWLGSLSETLGRRRTIALAALSVLPLIWPWVYGLWPLASGSEPLILAIGAFLMQFAVQGAWGIVPAHLNELSPGSIRGTFPGLTYQLGNLLASPNAPLQAGIAGAYGGVYAFALAIVAAFAALILAALVYFGPEAQGVAFDAGGTGHKQDPSSS
jgi:MFS transporter, SHS family, lactate transporter